MSALLCKLHNEFLSLVSDSDIHLEVEGETMGPTEFGKDGRSYNAKDESESEQYDNRKVSVRNP